GLRWSKYVGAMTWSDCDAIVGSLDGAWHHVAATTSATGMTFYVDGQSRASNADGRALSYALGNDFWVGRHGGGQSGFNFDGNLDEIRIYTRVLPLAEMRSVGS